MLQLTVPLQEVINFFNIGRRRHVVIEQAAIEKFLKGKVAAKLPDTITIHIQNTKTICRYLRRLTKHATAGTKQLQDLRKKAAKGPPIKVMYFLGDSAVKTFINCLQTHIKDLDNSLAKAKAKCSTPRVPGRSPRSIRRQKDNFLKDLRNQTGKNHVLETRIAKKDCHPARPGRSERQKVPPNEGAEPAIRGPGD